NSGAARSVALAGAHTTSAKSAAPSFAAAIPSPPKTQLSSPFTAPATIAASADVKQAVAEEEPGIPAKDAAALAIGITQEQVAEIKAAVQAQQKFLGELVEQSSLWELEGAELRIYFSPEKRPFAEMMEGRETLEKIRSMSSKVLGGAVRVCAKLEAVAAAAASAARGASGTQELRAQFERDPMVR